MTKLKANDFAELNKTYRQTNRSVFGVGRVIEIDGDLATVQWMYHTARELRDLELQTEQVPVIYLRRVKPDRESRFRAVRHAQTKGKTPRKAPVDLRRTGQYAVNRAALEYFGLRGYRLNVTATKLTDKVLAFEAAGCIGDDRVNVAELLA